MPGQISEYARLIKTRKIHYVPTCLILEIMLSVYGYAIRIPITRRALEDERSRIIDIFEILYNDLDCTLKVYESGEMGFFSGDWRSNRTKAQRIFSLLMVRLKKLRQYFWGPYLAQLRDVVQRIEETWRKLCLLLDERSGSQKHDRGTDSTRYFHSGDSESWQRTMGNIILELSAKTESVEGEYLLLICCTKIKARLLNQIEQMQTKRGTTCDFDGECILCVSDKEISATCPHCTRFTDEMLLSDKAGRIDTSTAFTLHPAYQAVLTPKESDAAAASPQSGQPSA